MSEMRDKIRAAAFNVKPKRKLTTFAGVEIEFRQPPIGEVMRLQGEENRKAVLADMLINYCYVPDTEEKVFEDTDVDSILSIPFGPDWVRVSQVIDELTSMEGQLKEAAKN